MWQTSRVHRAPHPHDDQQFAETSQNGDVMEQGQSGEGEESVGVQEGKGGEEIDGEISQPLDEFLKALQG